MKMNVGRRERSNLKTNSSVVGRMNIIYRIVEQGKWWAPFAIWAMERKGRLL
jgi:hypothetical protein